MPQILLIDHEASSHTLLTLQLQKLGCRVLHAFNGPEGEALALERRPVLILLEMVMPGQCGYEICQHLRTQGYRGAITMMGMLPEALGIKQAIECGANGYLSKPIAMSLVTRHLEYAQVGMKNSTVNQWLEHCGV